MASEWRQGGGCHTEGWQKYGYVPYVPYVRTPPLPLRKRRGKFGGAVVRGARWPSITKEHLALVREARTVWERAARSVGNPYVDNSALLLVGRQVIEATRCEDGLVILAAIRERIDPKSSPRRIPEWARLHGSELREREHNERKRAEKEAAARAFYATPPSERPHRFRPRKDEPGVCDTCAALEPDRRHDFAREAMRRLSFTPPSFGGVK